MSELFAWANALAAPYGARFTAPWGLLLLWAIPLSLVIALFSRTARWHVRVLQFLFRSAWILALTIAALQPIREEGRDSLEVVALVDISASLDEGRLARAQTALDTLKERKGEARLTVLSFAEKVSPEASDAVGDREETNLEAALSAGRAFFTPDRDHRMVLLSDGRATRGDAVAAAARAKEEKIPVYVLPLGGGDAPEVIVRSITLPDKARAKEEFSAEVLLESVGEEKIQLKLWARVAGGKGKPRAISTKRLTLPPGESSISLTGTLPAAGFYELRAEVLPQEGGDTFDVNNAATGYLTVEDLPKILLVRKPGEPTPPLDKALSHVATRYELDSAESLPQSLVALGRYDLVLLNNIETTKLTEEEGKLLTTYVTDLGGGLIVSAGDASKDLAEPPEDTPLEELLPLTFKRIKQKEEVPLAVAVVIDKSASMDRARKFEMAISSTKQAAKNLKEEAEITVILFDDLPYIALPLTKAKERETVESALKNLGVNGGTDLYPALRAAYSELKKSEAKIKHIIVLSDGESLSRYEQNSDLVDKITRDKITISTVGLSEDSDPVHLQLLAQKGGGTFYYTEDPDKLPDIFAKETQITTETTVKTAEFKVIAQAPADAIEGIDWSGAPTIKGYLTSQPKATSEVILVTGPKKEPILARWYRGLGRVAVFTSDAGGAWASSWTPWEGFPRFWDQLVRTSLRTRRPSTLLVKRRVDPDGTATVEIEARGRGLLPDEAAKVSLSCYDASGAEIPLTLTKGGRAVYTATFPLPEPGGYVLKASREGGEAEPETVVSDLFYGASPEFFRPGDDLSHLEAIALASSGAVLTSADALADIAFAEGSKTIKETEALWQPFVWLALAIFLLDVLSRRVA